MLLLDGDRTHIQGIADNPDKNSISCLIYSILQNLMNTILIAASALLFGMSPAVFAAEISPETVPIQNSSCFNSLKAETSPKPENLLLAKQPVDPVYIGPSTGPEEKCTYYIVRGKDGKIYDCRKCTYGGPYCFRRE